MKLEYIQFLLSCSATERKRIKKQLQVLAWTRLPYIDAIQLVLDAAIGRHENVREHRDRIRNIR